MELLESLDDGRMMIKVDIQKTVKCRKMIQMLPFFIAEVEDTNVWVSNQEVCDAYYDRLLLCAKDMLGENYHLLVQHLTEQEHDERVLFSLVSAITSSIQLESPVAQDILENSCVDAKAAILTRALEHSLGIEPRPAPLPLEGEMIRIDFREKTVLERIPFESV